MTQTIYNPQTSYNPQFQRNLNLQGGGQQPQLIDQNQIQNLRQQISQGSVDPKQALQQIQSKLRPESFDDTASYLQAKQQIAQSLLAGLGSIRTQDGQQGTVDLAGNVIRESTRMIQSTSGGAGTTRQESAGGNIPKVTVRSGDTLSKIAQRSGITLEQLLNLNPQYRANPNKIFPGQVVNLATTTADSPEQLQQLTQQRDQLQQQLQGLQQGQQSPSQQGGQQGNQLTEQNDVFGLLSDPELRSIYDSLPPQYKSLTGPMIQSLAQIIGSGQVVNPNIELTPQKNAEFLNQATSLLDPYYREQIANSQEDFTHALTNLQQDYERNVGRSQENFQQNLSVQAGAEADQGTAFSSERGNRQQRAINLQQQALDDAYRQQQEDAYTTGRQIEQGVGSSALTGATIPTIGQYQVGAGGYTPTGQTRQLYTPRGTFQGDLQRERQTAIENQRSLYEGQYRQQQLASSEYDAAQRRRRLDIQNIFYGNQ